MPMLGYDGANILPGKPRKGEVWIREKPPKAVADNRPIPTKPDYFDFERRDTTTNFD